MANPYPYEKQNFDQNSVFVLVGFFLFCLTLWTPINASFPKVVEVSSFFFPSWSHLNIFKVFPHLALSLITSLLLYKGRRSHDMWSLHWFLWSCDQSDSWLELGSSGFAILSVELLLQDGPGLQRQLLHGMSSRRRSMTEQLVSSLV